MSDEHDPLIDPRLPAFDACDVCGHPRGTRRCSDCGLWLCNKHSTCPECEEEFAPLSDDE